VLRGREALGLSHSCVKEAVVTGLEAAIALEDPKKVDEILEIVHADSLGRRTLYFQAHASRVEARSPDRAEDEAERLFKSSIGDFREIGFPFWMAVTLLEFGEWLTRRVRADDATAPLTEAREIFGRLDARPWLERLERVGEPEAATR
jgi:hypothetical protein